MNNNIGTYDYITLEYILAGCKQDLGIRDSTIDDLTIKDSINLGLQELELTTGSNTKFIAQLPIDSVTKSCKLPQGFKGFTQRCPIVYCDAEGNAVNGTSNQTVTSIVVDGSGNSLGSTTVDFANNWGNGYGPVFSNNTFFKNSPYGSAFNLNGSMEIVNGTMWFSTNVVAEFVKFSFWGVNIDITTGNIRIPFYCERALRAFACYRYLRTLEKPIFQDYYREWCNAKEECRGIANRMDSMQQAFVNGIWKSLI